jgi:hypothetical protein
LHLLPHSISYLLGAGVVISVLAGVYLCDFGVKNQRKYDFLKDPPLVWINGIPHGFVHVRGKAQIEAPLTSPLTQMPCCYHRTTIERVTSASPDKRGSYDKIADQPKAKRFYIDDGTGRVLVHPRGAEYELPKIFSVEIDARRPGIKEAFVVPGLDETARPNEDRLRQYLADHGITGSSSNGQRESSVNYRLTEYCLLPGQETSVFGTCETHYGPESPGGCSIIRKNEHLPALAITNRNEMRVCPHLRYVAIASFSAGLLLIGFALASALLLIYPTFV